MESAADFITHDKAERTKKDLALEIGEMSDSTVSALRSMGIYDVIEYIRQRIAVSTDNRELQQLEKKLSVLKSLAATVKLATDVRKRNNDDTSGDDDIDGITVSLVRNIE